MSSSGRIRRVGVWHARAGTPCEADTWLTGDGEGIGHQPQIAASPVAVGGYADDEAGLLQDVDVMSQEVGLDTEPPPALGRRRVGEAELIDDGTPVAVGQGGV